MDYSVFHNLSLKLLHCAEAPACGLDPENANHHLTLRDKADWVLELGVGQGGGVHVNKIMCVYTLDKPNTRPER